MELDWAIFVCGLDFDKDLNGGAYSRTGIMWAGLFEIVFILFCIMEDRVTLYYIVVALW